MERRSAPAERSRGPQRARPVLAICSMGAALAFIDATIVNIAFPDIARSYPEASISHAVVGAQRLQHRLRGLPRRRGPAGRPASGGAGSSSVGLELFTFASVLCAVAPSPGTLIARSACSRRSARRFSSRRRWRWCSTRSRPSAARTAWRCCPRSPPRRPASGPRSAGLLVAAGDWRLVFLVNLPIGIADGRARAPPSGREPCARPPADARPAGRARAARWRSRALVLGGREGRRNGAGSTHGCSGSFAAALVLGAVFVWRCATHRAPVVDLSLLRRPDVHASPTPMTILTGRRLLRLHAGQRPLPHRACGTTRCSRRASR